MAVVIDQHQNGFRPFRRSQRCKLQSFTQLNFSMMEFSQMNNSNISHSLKRAFDATDTFHRSFSTPCLSAYKSDHEECFHVSPPPNVEIISGHGVPKVRALVVDVAISMASGTNPIPISNGLGGVYLFRSRHGDSLAVAKPIDEEPLAFNNPKGFVGQTLGQPGLKRSIRVGETGIREVAAYLLDHGAFAGVPPTALVKISHMKFHMTHKIASLQRFVDHDSDAADLGPGGFSVVSVHRIGILDVRLLNLDRHAGNILVKNRECVIGAGAANLVPIDHGLCLPEWLDNPYFEWLHWPQASVPFSEAEINYISNLNPFKDAQLLATALPSLRVSSVRILVVCTIFLKSAVAAGLCLSDIGQMMTRECCGGEEKVSTLESICAQARDGSMGGHGDCSMKGDDDSDDDDDGNDTMFLFDHVLNVGKPPKIPRFSTMASTGVVLDTVVSSRCHEDESNWERRRMAGGLTRSVSFAGPKHKHEEGGICFGEMGEEEWEEFLVAFVELLPQAFEGVKSTGLKQRLGGSCEF